MKIRLQVFTGVLVALLFIVVHSSQAQKRDVLTMEDMFAALKPGQWAQLEGIVHQPGAFVQCTEVKVLTGDMLNYEWEITGVVQRVNSLKQEMDIFRIPVKVQPDAVFSEKAGTFKSFADVQTKTIVKAYGTYLKDGTFAAKRLKNKPLDPGAKPDEDPYKEIEVVGQVQSVDPTNRRVTLMGITFQITDRTDRKYAAK